MKDIMISVVRDVIILIALAVIILGVTFGIHLKNSFDRSVEDDRNWATTYYRGDVTYTYRFDKDEIVAGALDDSAAYFRTLANDAMVIYQ